jgi:hypothetical protein
VTVATAEVLNPTPRPRRIRLETVRDVRRELHGLYREARSGKLDPSVATRLAYLLQISARLFEVSELERRVALLEASNVT